MEAIVIVSREMKVTEAACESTTTMINAMPSTKKIWLDEMTVFNIHNFAILYLSWLKEHIDT